MHKGEHETVNGGLEHFAEVSGTMKALKKIDGFMYGSNEIKAALDQGFTTGEIGIFALDCIVAEGKASLNEIGKIPTPNMEEVVNTSPLIWQGGTLEYVAKTLEERGLSVQLWAFIGDDDFKYSVSTGYSIDNPEIQDILQLQVATLQSALKQELFGTQVDVHVEGWLEHEEGIEIADVRTCIKDGIMESLQANTLSDKVMKRLDNFVNWRIELVVQAGLDPSDYQEIILGQALEELSSFVTQGLLVPSILRSDQPNLPLIFINTYPNTGIQNLDDECIRLGKALGLEGYSYGTIHAPGPEKLAKFLGRNQPRKVTQAFGCGETKERKQEEKVLWQNILAGTGGGDQLKK